jgi:hypothetical protein
MAAHTNRTVWKHYPAAQLLCNIRSLITRFKNALHAILVCQSIDEVVVLDGSAQARICSWDISVPGDFGS